MHPLVGALLLLAATPGRAAAHGFGQRYDLPVPLALWVTGAAAAVAFSFVVIGLFVRGSPGTHGYPRANLLRWRLGRLLADTRLRLGAQGVAVGLLGVVVFAGFAGDQTPTRNFAPIWVWVVWWVGVAYVSALVGNLWAVVNPWAVLFGWAEALVRRLGGTRLALAWRYPRWLGMWPASVLFAAFAWPTCLQRAGDSRPARPHDRRLLAHHVDRDVPVRARGVAPVRGSVRRRLRAAGPLRAHGRCG